MFSRLIVILTLPLFIAHCSFDTKDAETKQTLKVADSSSNLKCIDRDVVKFLGSGFENANETNIHLAFDCLVYAIDIIDSHINVRDNDDIKIANVKKLVKKKVKSYSAKTDKIIDVFFAAKNKALKGKSDRISHVELKKLKIFINDLRALFVDIFPAMKLMAQEDSFQASAVSVSKSIYRLKKAENKFYSIFSKYKINISKSEIESWLSATDLFEEQGRKDKWELYWRFHHMMWPQYDDINYRNVSYWLDGVRSVMSWVVKKRFSWTMENYMSGETTHDVLSSTDDILLFVQRALNNKDTKAIYYSDINKAIDYFDRIYGLPRALTAGTVKKMIPLVVEKLIGVPSVIRAKQGYKQKVYGKEFKPYYKGITMNHFNNLSSEYEIYKSIQLAIVEGKISSTDTKSKVGPSNHLAHFSNIIKKIHPYFAEGDLGLFVESKNDPNKYNNRNLSMMNFFRFLGRAIAMGYTFNSGRKDMYTGIKVHELEKFVSEFEGFFAEIYIMEKRNPAKSVADRMYTEAKLFVGSGDGYKNVYINDRTEKSLISFVQSVEVMSNYTSGMFSITKVYDGLLAKCEAQKHLMSFGRPSLTKECFNENYIPTLIKHIDNLPNLKKYLVNYLSNRELNEKGYYPFEDSLFFAGQEAKNVGNDYISYTDVSIIGTLLTFIESIFLKFDLNSNGLIDEGEVDSSYQYFKEMIGTKEEARCSGVKFRHVLLYKREGNLFQKSKVAVSCGGNLIGNKYNEALKASKKWFSKQIAGARARIKKILNLKEEELSENEIAKLELLKEAEKEIEEANKRNKNFIINKDNNIEIDRGDILEILSIIKEDSLKKKNK